MKRPSRARTTTQQLRIVVALLLGTWMVPAHAYLDPGTGSLIIQGIIGAIAAIGVTSRLYWYRIKAYFNGDQNRTNETEDDKTTDPENPAP